MQNFSFSLIAYLFHFCKMDMLKELGNIKNKIFKFHNVYYNTIQKSAKQVSFYPF